MGCGVVMPMGSVRLRDTRNVTQLKGFAEGYWWVQDLAATIPAGSGTLGGAHWTPATLLTWAQNPSFRQYIPTESHNDHRENGDANRASRRSACDRAGQPAELRLPCPA
jgi:hypothetical protein